MGERKTDTDLWFRYIVKQNDRALSRRTASGLTTWAVAAVIATLLFQVVDRLPLIVTGSGTVPLHALAVVGTIDLLVFGLLFLFALLIGGITTIEARLATRLDAATEPVVLVPTLVIMLGVAVLNFYTFGVARKHNLWGWPFVLLGIFFAVEAIGPIASKISTRVRTRGVRDLPNLSAPLTASASRRAHFAVTLVAIGFVGTAIAAIPVVQAFPHVTTTFQAETLKWAMRVDAVLLLFVFCCFRLSGFLRERHLERLERRIVLEGLTGDEIGQLYVREYLGPTVQDWLAEAEEELSRLYAEFEQAAETAEERFHEVAQVDRSMTYEISGRMKEICSMIDPPRDAYTKYVKELLRKLLHLTGQQAFSETAEILRKLTGSLEHQLDLIKQRYDEVCAVCKDATRATAETGQDQTANPSGSPNCLSHSSASVGTGDQDN